MTLRLYCLTIIRNKKYIKLPTLIMWGKRNKTVLRIDRNKISAVIEKLESAKSTDNKKLIDEAISLLKELSGTERKFTGRTIWIKAPTSLHPTSADSDKSIW